MIGFIGLGIMGSRMAANLQSAGYDLVVHNRTKAKADALLNKGAIWAETPAEMAEMVDILITMLPHPQVVEEVALGTDGFLPRMAQGKAWIDSSTVSPAFSRKMATEAKAQGIHFLDAPVAGSKIPAENGELAFLVGGPGNILKKHMPLLLAMGKTVRHVGEHGMGSSMKMVVNLMLGSAMSAFSEAITLGNALGIPQEQLFNTLIGGPVTAPFLGAKADKIRSANFDAEFPLQWMHKDLELVAETAYEYGIALPATNLIKELFALANIRGLSNEDFSAIYKLLEKK